MRVTITGKPKPVAGFGPFRFHGTAVIGPKDELVAICYLRDGTLPGMKHARLFAASPDLLEACKMIKDDFEKHGGPAPIYNVAVRAIAKAEGE